MDSVAQHVQVKLADIGQRFTSGRRVIVESLQQAGRPLSMPEILKATQLAQSSVYRNLTVLENAGVVVRVLTNDEWGRFELSEDLTGHHHHMVCARCGAMADVRIPDALEHELDKVLARLAKKQGFSMDHHRLDVIGHCDRCHSRTRTTQQKEKTS